MRKLTPIKAEAVTSQSGSSYPEPFKSRMGDANWRALGDAFALTQFGINLETLQPGAESALRHWHSLADEFVYIVSGELILRNDDGEFPVTAGMCAGFKAGDNNAHHLVNHSDSEARFLVVGSRVPGDNAFYPDDDLAWFDTGSETVAVHKDGSSYPGE
jgi:uncharacterized cupin superfamily protein